MLNTEHANFPRAGFFRRLGAACYDLLLAIAVFMVAGAIGFGLFFGLTTTGLVSMNGFEHVADALNGTALYHAMYQLWLALCVCTFYALFWS
ncbi:MAG: RDD family protein, partial [Shewanella sp.]